MLSEDWKKDEPIEIEDFGSSPFLSLLRWIYCKELVFKEGCLLDVMRLASKYLVYSLTNAVKDLSVAHLYHIWSIVSHAMEFGDKRQQQKCWYIIASKTKTLIREPDFLNATPLALVTLTAFDELHVKEVDLFNACLKWTVAECRRRKLPVTPEHQRLLMSPFIKQFAFQTMSMSEFVSSPCESGILTGDEQAIIMRFIAGRAVDTPFRKSRVFLSAGTKPKAELTYGKVAGKAPGRQTYSTAFPHLVLAVQDHRSKRLRTK